MIILDDEYKGKPIFNVGFLDFCKIVCRGDSKNKFNLNNSTLMEHIKKTRYSRDFAVEYKGIIYFPKK